MHVNGVILKDLKLVDLVTRRSVSRPEVTEWTATRVRFSGSHCDDLGTVLRHLNAKAAL